MAQTPLHFLYADGHFAAAEENQGFFELNVDAEFGGEFDESAATDGFTVDQDAVTIEDDQFQFAQCFSIANDLAAPPKTPCFCTDERSWTISLPVRQFLTGSKM